MAPYSKLQLLESIPAKHSNLQFRTTAYGDDKIVKAHFILLNDRQRQLQGNNPRDYAKKCAILAHTRGELATGCKRGIRSLSPFALTVVYIGKDPNGNRVYNRCTNCLYAELSDDGCGAVALTPPTFPVAGIVTPHQPCTTMLSNQSNKMVKRKGTLRDDPATDTFTPNYKKARTTGDLTHKEKRDEAIRLAQATFQRPGNTTLSSAGIDSPDQVLTSLPERSLYNGATPNSAGAVPKEPNNSRKKDIVPDINLALSTILQLTADSQEYRLELEKENTQLRVELAEQLARMDDLKSKCTKDVDKAIQERDSASDQHQKELEEARQQSIREHEEKLNIMKRQVIKIKAEQEEQLDKIKKQIQKLNWDHTAELQKASEHSAEELARMKRALYKEDGEVNSQGQSQESVAKVESDIVSKSYDFLITKLMCFTKKDSPFRATCLNHVDIVRKHNSTLSKEVLESNQQLRELAQRNLGYVKEIKDLRRVVSNLEKTSDKFSKEIRDPRDDESKADRRMEEMLGLIKSLREEKAELERRRVEANESRNALNRKIAAKDGEWSDARRILENKVDSLRSREKDYLSTQQKHVDREHSLSSQLHNLEKELQDFQTKLTKLEGRPKTSSSSFSAVATRICARLIDISEKQELGSEALPDPMGFRGGVWDNKPAKKLFKAMYGVSVEKFDAADYEYGKDVGKMFQLFGRISEILPRNAVQYQEASILVGALRSIVCKERPQNTEEYEDFQAMVTGLEILTNEMLEVNGSSQAFD